jgi:signal transduction histidine kinase
MTISADASGEVVSSIGDRRLREQVFRLYENAPIGFAASLINSSILVGILRNEIDAEVLAVWWCSLVGLTLARTVQFQWFRAAAEKEPFDSLRWSRFFVAGIFGAGLLWGSAGIWLLPPSVPHQTFIAFVLGGMVAGAAGTFSARMDAFVAYAIPTLAPVSIHFLLFGDELRVAMGTMMLLFLVLLTWTAHRVNRLISRTLDLDGEIETVRAYAFGEAGELTARLRDSERAKTELERKLGDRGDDVEERLRQCVSDMTDTFVTLLEKSEHRLESHWRVRVEQARLDATTGFAQGVAYRVYEAVQSVSDHLRLHLLRPESNGSRSTVESLRSIEVSLESAQGLVDDLLVYANDDIEDAIPVALNELVRSASEQWEATVSEDVGIRVCESEPPVLVRGDSRGLRLAVHQLLANACEAVAQKGGTVEVRVHIVSSDEVPSSEDSVVHGALHEGPVAAIEIVDDGDGMPRETLDRVFEPFFSTKSRSRGLGMAIVSAVIRRHRGRVLVDSHPLLGTRVRVFLPATEAVLAPHVH